MNSINVFFFSYFALFNILRVSVCCCMLCTTYISLLYVPIQHAFVHCKKNIFVVLLFYFFYRKERFVVVFAIKLLQYSKMSSEQENRVEVEWDSGWLTCVYLFPIYGKEVLIVLRLIRLNQWKCQLISSLILFRFRVQNSLPFR